MDFDELFVPFETVKTQFESVWNTVNLLHVTTDIMEKNRFSALFARAERAYVLRFTSETIFNHLKKIEAEFEEKKHLNTQQARILERYMTEYKGQGYELSEERKLELSKNWNKKLARRRLRNL